MSAFELKEDQNLAKSVFKHSIKLGIPPEILPSEQFIEKIGRTKNSSMLHNFVELSDTKQAVKTARMNVFVLDRNEGKNKTSIIKKYLRMKKLEEKLIEVHKRNAQAKHREKKLLDNIFDNDIHILKSKMATESVEVKVEILQAKVEQLELQINCEVSLEKKTNSVSTPQIHSNLMKEEEVLDEIQRCLEFLQQFYSEPSIDPDTTKIWDEMRKTFKSIPNVLTFNAILKGLDSADSKLKHAMNCHKKSTTPLKMLITKIDQRLITSAIVCISREKKTKEIKTLCGNNIQSLTNSLEGILNQSIEYSFQCDDESVGDFVAVSLRQSDLQGKLRKCNGLINELKLQSSEKDTTVKELSSKILDTQKIQKLTEEKISHFQQIIAQSFMMNNKLQNCKLSMVHLVQNLKNANKFLQMSRTMNLNATGDHSLINHVAEIQAFASADFEKFGVASPTIEFEIKRNRLLKVDDNITLLVKHNLSDISGTIKNLLNLIKNNFEESRKFHSIAVKNKPKAKRDVVVDTVELQKQLEINRNGVIEKLDQISSVNAKTIGLLSDNKRLFEYSLTNPLKAFIPFVKKFDGKNFKAYENDFNLYYRMIKDNN